MKRIICFLLTVLMVLSNIVCAENTEKVDKYQNSVKVVNGLGLMEVNSENSDNAVTRGEMSQILYKILNYDMYDSVSGEWQKKFYGDKDANLSQLPIIESDNIFSDVDSENEYYNSILFVSDYGIMVGDGAGSFRPDEKITPVAAVKTLINIMGYSNLAENMGGYPTGYKQLSIQLKLMSAEGDSITKSEVAKLIYNALMANYSQNYDLNEIKIDGNDSILEKFLHISYIKGTLNDNGIVSLTGDDSAGSDAVNIGGETLTIDEQRDYVRDYLGREVEAYYKSSGNENEYQVVLACLTEKDECTTIEGKNVVSYSKGVLEYEVGSSTKSTRIESGAAVVYNNTFMSTYTNDIFQEDNSYISVITSRGKSNPDIVIITSYESMFVGGIDTKDYKIYNKIRYDGKDNVVELDESKKEIIVYKADGTKGTFSDIKADSLIDVAQGDNSAIVKMCDTTVMDFAIKSISENSYGTVFSNGEAEYNVCRVTFAAHNAPEIIVGKKYNIYINTFGQIAWIEFGESDSLKFGYLLKIINDTDSGAEQSRINILNSKNEWDWLCFCDRLIYSNENGVEKSIKKDDIYATLLSYRGLIRYKTNDDGNVKYIEIPITDVNCTTDNKLRLLGKVGYEDANNDGKADGTVWRTGGGNIGPEIIISGADVKIVAENPVYDVFEKDRYSFKGLSIFKDFESYTLDAYVTKYDSHRAEFVSLISQVNEKNITATDRTVAIIKDIQKVVNEDDEIVSALYVYNLQESYAGAETVLYLKDDGVLNNITNCFEDTDETGNSICYTLNKGDIIRYSLDTYDKVEQIQLFWDESMPNQLNPLGKTGGYPGATLWWDESLAGRTNPYGFVTTGVVSKKPLEITGLNFRTVYGYAYKIVGGVLTTTTQDLFLNTTYDKTKSDSRFVSESYIISNKTNIAAVDMDNSTVTVKAGSEEDIKTFDKYGSNCSRIIYVNSNGGVGKMIIINGTLKK